MQEPPSTAPPLPAPLTPLVGRRRDLDEIGSRLATTRLLTLTGAGGCGKTRLALEAALAEAATGEDVRLVELAAVRDGAVIPAVIAAAVGLSDSSGVSPLEALTEYLRHRRLLLVLDNCEHLIAACAPVVDALLRGCAALRVLATSREALRVVGEVAWLVPSLSVPEPAERPGADQVVRAEAAQLFSGRARAYNPSFDLTDGNAAAVADICRRLDGIPLALELAAARVSFLTPAEIAARLDDRFRLLTGGSRTALPRQQTLRAAIAWSFDLLVEEQRTVFDRLAVFAGSFSLAAAEVVCAGGSVPSDRVFDLLGELVDRSLVLAEPGGDTTRYRVLETIRQFGRDRLADAGELDGLEDRHAAYFLTLAVDAAGHLRSAEQLAYFSALDREYDNLRAALRRLIAQGDAVRALRLAVALFWFWRVRGFLAEGRGLLAEALAMAGVSVHERLVAEARTAEGALAWLQGDSATARPLLFGSIGVARGVRDHELVASALTYLGLVLMTDGHLEDARVAAEESVALAFALTCLGLTLQRVRGADAVRLHEESLALFRSLEDRFGVSLALQGLGTAAMTDGDDEVAGRLQMQSLTLRRELSERRGMAISLQGLANVARRRQRVAEAAERYAEALRILRSLWHTEYIAGVLVEVSELLLAQRRAGPAARLLGAVAAAGVRSRQPVGDQIRDDVNQTLADIRGAREPAAFVERREDGPSLDIDQAIDVALEALEQLAESSTSDRKSHENRGALTPREHEVAALIARGMTNRQIAEALVISEGTAANHVEHILGKLGFQTRSQVAAWIAIVEPRAEPGH